MKIKFCGITSFDDYKKIVELGADYTGFIFFKESKRYILPEDAANICIENSTNIRVGVFVDEDIETVRDIYEKAGLDVVQLHGNESPDYCNSLGLPYWKVFRVKSVSDIEKFKNYECKTILIDTYSKENYGGTGKTINKKLVEKAILKGKEINKKVIVAGGIGIENIKDVLALNPYGVDINSMVEISAGVKDLKKVKNIISFIKGNIV